MTDGQQRVTVGMERQNSGITDLHLAAQRGDTDKVQNLITDHKLDINAVDEKGNTALHDAVDRGHLATAKCLLELGAKVDIINNKGEGPLHLATREERSELMSILVDEAEDLDRKNAAGDTAIHIAALKGNVKIAEKLSKRGADINKTNDENDDTPLHIALQKADSKGHWKTVNVLLKMGAKVDQRNKRGETALHLAARKDALDADLVKAIVNKYEDELGRKNGEGLTPLHIAAAGGHYKTATIFIDHGADPFIRNYDGDTPLHLASANGYPETMAALIACDKNTIFSKNTNNDMPFHMSVKNGRAKGVNKFMDLFNDDEKLWVRFKNELDFEMFNPIYDAIDKGHENVVLVIARSKYWKDFFMSSSEEDGMKVTPLRRMIEEMPTATKVVLDQCISEGHTEKGQIKSLILNFELVDDTYTAQTSSNEGDENHCGTKKVCRCDDSCLLTLRSNYEEDKTVGKQNHPLMLIAQTEDHSLLDHPLVKALLKRKWTLSMAVYFIFLVFYSLFIISLTVFMTMTSPPFGGHKHDEEPLCNETTAMSNSGQRSESDVLRYCIYVLASLGIAMEVVQLVMMHHTSYIELHNLFDWFTYIMPIVVVTKMTECGRMTDWQWQLGVACLFVSYMNMLFFLRIIPMMGIYIMMIALMLQNFLRFIIIMFLFGLAFSMCFYLLLQNQHAFSTPSFAIIKNWVMMIGEVDFNDVFFGHKEDEAHSSRLYFERLTWMMYIIFFVFMSLIIMNLLTSLAVIGVESLQDDSKYKIMALQIELALDVEFAMPMFIKRKMSSVVKSCEIRTRHNKKIWRGLTGFFTHAVYGDLSDRDIVSQALKIVEERSEKVGTDRDSFMTISKMTLENTIGHKTRNMRAQINTIDKNLDQLDRRVKDIEDKVCQIYDLMTSN